MLPMQRPRAHRVPHTAWQGNFMPAVRAAGPCFQILPVFPRTMSLVGEKKKVFFNVKQKPEQLEARPLQ